MSDIRINGKPLHSLRVVDLKEELDKRGLSKSGKKDELLQRLESFLEVNPEEDVTTKPEEDEPVDVIEASRIEAEQRRLAEEKRQEERKKQEEEEKRIRQEEEERKRREAEEAEKKRKEAEEKQKEEEERHKRELEEKRKKEEEERQRKEDEERKKREIEEKRRKEEEQKRKMEEEEKRKKEEERLIREKLKQKELEEKRRKEIELENKRKEEEEERKRREDRKRKEEEDERKRKEEKKRKKEEDRQRKEEETRKEEERQKAIEEEKKKEKEREERKKRDLETAKHENENKEQRLKEELLKRLREQKEKDEKESRKDGGKKEDEEEGDLTLVMEIDQNDIVSEDVNKEKKDSDKENQEGEVVPGQVKSLRRLGAARGGQESEKKKRGWGSSRSSRISSSDNIEITSNSLKDIVPDMKPLMSKNVVLEEEEVKNGHNSGEDDDEIGPTLPTEKEKEKAPVPRKKIKMEDDSAESDVILVMNLTRPFTIPQLKQMLQRTGTIEDFWIDKIKSRCCVKFASVAQASETRMALNGVTWPSDNKNPLHVVFSNTENLERLKKQVEQPTRIVTSNGVGVGATRDWDRDKVGGGGGSDRRAGRERSEENSVSRQPTKSLEELFNKTKQLPALYWKPLSEETIQRKEEARNRRVLAAIKNKKSKSRSRS